MNHRDEIRVGVVVYGHEDADLHHVGLLVVAGTHGGREEASAGDGGGALDHHAGHVHPRGGRDLRADRGRLGVELTLRELEFHDQSVVLDEAALVPAQALALRLEGGLHWTVRVGRAGEELVAVAVGVGRAGWAGGQIARGVPVEAWVALAVREVAAQAGRQGVGGAGVLGAQVAVGGAARARLAVELAQG